jgi:membrane fusion protein (multidrug efflux system)
MRIINVIICLIVLVGFLMAAAGCGNNSNSAQDKDEEEEVFVPVEVSEVTVGDISAYFTGTASLEAEEETEVVAKVGGVVTAILVEEGDYVEAGQILARLDDEKLTVQLEQTRANLQKLESEYLRSEELFDKGLISAEEYQAAKYEYEYQKESFNLAKLDVRYVNIRSPISGVVSERLIKVGNMILLNQATFHVTGLEPLLAVLHVPERNIGKLQVGHNATLIVDAMEDFEFSGRIKRISPVVDPSTGTLKVTVDVIDETKRLKPGMFTRINITYDTHTEAMLVPKDAIIAEDRESAVFVVRDSVAFRQTVKTGYTDPTHIEILAGLQPGDIIVTTGKGSLKDSAKVELVSNDLSEHAHVQ